MWFVSKAKDLSLAEVAVCICILLQPLVPKLMGVRGCEVLLGELLRLEGQGGGPPAFVSSRWWTEVVVEVVSLCILALDGHVQHRCFPCSFYRPS